MIRTLILALALAATPALAKHHDKEHHMPKEAMAACEGHKEGTECHYEHDGHKVMGHCHMHDKHEVCMKDKKKKLLK